MTQNSTLHDSEGARQRLGNISKRTLERIPEDELPRVRLGTRLIRYREQDLDALIERRLSKKAA